jgi:hypothetical protein
MPVMIFVGGAITGAVVGLVFGAVLQRRSTGSSLFESRSLATAVALIALIVAAGALANSERDRGQNGGVSDSAASAPTTTRTTAAAASTTTTAETGGDSLVIVPNVSHPPLTRADAEAALKRAHLAVTVQTLRLLNVPSGFVISQNPLPESTTTAGSTVTIVVSAPA